MGTKGYGKPLSYEAVRCIYEKAREKAGVENEKVFTPDAIRLQLICSKPPIGVFPWLFPSSALTYT